MEDEKKLVLDFLSKNYTEERVTEDFDEEVNNWVDSDWEDDGNYSDEYEWYIDHNNGEAQDVVIRNIVEDIKSNVQNLIHLQDEELISLLKEEYSCLSY